MVSLAVTFAVYAILRPAAGEELQDELHEDAGAAYGGLAAEDLGVVHDGLAADAAFAPIGVRCESWLR